jgi:hypothetical protein
VHNARNSFFSTKASGSEFTTIKSTRPLSAARLSKLAASRIARSQMQASPSAENLARALRLRHFPRSTHLDGRSLDACETCQCRWSSIGYRIRQDTGDTCRCHCCYRGCTSKHPSASGIGGVLKKRTSCSCLYHLPLMPWRKGRVSNRGANKEWKRLVVSPPAKFNPAATLSEIGGKMLALPR